MNVVFCLKALCLCLSLFLNMATAKADDYDVRLTLSDHIFVISEYRRENVKSHLAGYNQKFSPYFQLFSSISGVYWGSSSSAQKLLLDIERNLDPLHDVELYQNYLLQIAVVKSLQAKRMDEAALDEWLSYTRKHSGVTFPVLRELRGRDRNEQLQMVRSAMSRCLSSGSLDRSVCVVYLMLVGNTLGEEALGSLSRSILDMFIEKGLGIPSEYLYVYSIIFSLGKPLGEEFTRKHICETSNDLKKITDFSRVSFEYRHIFQKVNHQFCGAAAESDSQSSQELKDFTPYYLQTIEISMEEPREFQNDR